MASLLASLECLAESKRATKGLDWSQVLFWFSRYWGARQSSIFLTVNDILSCSFPQSWVQRTLAFMGRQGSTGTVPGMEEPELLQKILFLVASSLCASPDVLSCFEESLLKQCTPTSTPGCLVSGTPLALSLVCSYNVDTCNLCIKLLSRFWNFLVHTLIYSFTLQGIP